MGFWGEGGGGRGRGGTWGLEGGGTQVACEGNWRCGSGDAQQEVGSGGRQDCGSVCVEIWLEEAQSYVSPVFVHRLPSRCLLTCHHVFPDCVKYRACITSIVTWIWFIMEIFCSKHLRMPPGLVYNACQRNLH